MAVPAGHLCPWCSMAAARLAPRAGHLPREGREERGGGGYLPFGGCLRLGDTPAGGDNPSGCLFAPALIWAGQGV